MIIKTNIVPKGFVAITIFPFIFTKDKNAITINHEKIHLRQQAEMLILPFFIFYLVEAIIRGYRSISFEKEAYENENNLNYLKNRKLYSWVKYL